MLRKISAVVLPTMLAVAIVAFMLARVWDDLLIALDHAVYSYLLLAVVICIGAWFLRGWRYLYILSSLAVTVSLWLSTACIYLSQTANLIVPARLGDLIRIFVLHHEVDAKYSESLSSIVVERFFDIITVALLGALALPFVLNVPDWFVTIIYAAIILCGVFVVFLLFAGRFESGNKYLAMGLRLIAQVREASLSVASVTILSASSIAIWITDIVICYVIALMFGTSVSFIIVALAIVIGNLVKAVPVTPGGIGTYELAVALTLGLGGVAPALATLIAVIDHLVKNLVTLGGGIVSLSLFGGWSVDLMRRAFSRSLDTEEVAK